MPKPTGSTRITLAKWCLLPSCLLLLFCGEPTPPRDPLAEIQESGTLKVLTAYSPTTYYQGREELEGFEYELALSFAEFMGVEPEFTILDTTSDIMAAIAENQGHIAAAGLTRTPEREEHAIFGPDYFTVQQEVVYRRGFPRPRRVEDLYGLNLLVAAGTSYEETLERLCLKYENLAWSVTEDYGTEQILEMVWNREVDCTIADSNIVAINRRYMPELAVGFALTKPQPFAWMIAPDYEALLPLLDQWKAEMDRSWRLDELEERYYGYFEIFDYVDIKRYHRRIEDRLPRFQTDFQAAADTYGFSWTLLAAQAYQESHWDINARSPTGVRGIMMLTLRTSKQVGVVDRLNPKESIMGGARYLEGLYKRLPEEIIEPDRTWIALASYNVGFGHVMDARRIARDKGLDPNMWSSLQETLPLLAKREYYRHARYGYARGREPVRYVQRIRNFRDILEQRLTQIAENAPSE